MPRFKTRPPIDRNSPTVNVGAVSVSQVNLGRLAEVGRTRDVVMHLDGEHVIAIVGKRGSGKTYTLGVLAEGLTQVSAAGDSRASGRFDHAVLILDTLNLFQWVDLDVATAEGASAEAQRKDLHKWGLVPARISPNFWHVSGSEPAIGESNPFTIRPSDMNPGDWAMLIGCDTVTDPMGQLLVAAKDKVGRTGWTAEDGSIAAIADHSVEHLIECIAHDPELSSEFASETRRAVTQRLKAFVRTGLFSPEGTNISDLLDPGELSVVLLRGVPDDVRATVAFLLIRKLLEERSKASEAAKHALVTGADTVPEGPPKTWVLIDEAQNIIPTRGDALARDTLTRFVREGRNFGLSMAISTQQPKAIDERVMAQVDMLMAHTLTVKQDIAYITGNLKSADPTSISSGSDQVSVAEAIRLLDTGQCLVSSTDAERAFFLNVRPRVTLHGGFEA